MEIIISNWALETLEPSCTTARLKLMISVIQLQPCLFLLCMGEALQYQLWAQTLIFLIKISFQVPTKWKFCCPYITWNQNHLAIVQQSFVNTPREAPSCVSVLLSCPWIQILNIFRVQIESSVNSKGSLLEESLQTPQKREHLCRCNHLLVVQ